MERHRQNYVSVHKIIILIYIYKLQKVWTERLAFSITVLFVSALFSLSQLSQLLFLNVIVNGRCIASNRFVLPFLIAFYLHHAIMVSINDRVDVIPHSGHCIQNGTTLFCKISLSRKGVDLKSEFYKAKINTKVARFFYCKF